MRIRPIVRSSSTRAFGSSPALPRGQTPHVAFLAVEMGVAVPELKQCVRPRERAPRPWGSDLAGIRPAPTPPLGGEGAPVPLFPPARLGFPISPPGSSHTPPLVRRYMDKKLRLKLNGNRGVVGVLRGFDQFLNLVLDEAVNDTGDRVGWWWCAATR